MNTQVYSVRVVKNWDYPDLFAQSPGGNGRWGRISVTADEVETDYVVVLNQPSIPTNVHVDPQCLWAIIQEPPTPYHRWLHDGQKAMARIYTTDPRLAGRADRYVISQPALAWHVGLSYDELIAKPFPQKTRDVAWITSNLSFLPQHRIRMAFLEKVRPAGLVDLFGRGIRPIERKWEALAPSRYAIAFENWTGPDYWSEKIADCFLAGAMPIYVGCTNLEKYFPSNSFIRIDPRASDPVALLKSIVESDAAERNREAVLEARHLILQKYQFFPFIDQAIAAHRQNYVPQMQADLALRVRKLRQPYYLAKAVWHWKIKPALSRRGKSAA